MKKSSVQSSSAFEVGLQIESNFNILTDNEPSAFHRVICLNPIFFTIDLCGSPEANGGLATERALHWTQAFYLEGDRSRHPPNGQISGDLASVIPRGLNSFHECLVRHGDWSSACRFKVSARS